MYTYISVNINKCVHKYIDYLMFIITALIVDHNSTNYKANISQYVVTAQSLI